MIEFLRTTVTPTLVTERMNEVSARGWAISTVTLATKDERGRPDSFQIDATRDALLYVELPGKTAIHRDDLFYRLSRLDAESRGALLAYMAQLEGNRKIVDSPPQSAQAIASTVPPPPPNAPRVIAAATGGTEVPSDPEIGDGLTFEERNASVDCPCCEGDGAIDVEPDPDDGIEVNSVPCPCCNGVRTVSRRVADQFQNLQGRYLERARQTAKTMTKNAHKLARMKEETARRQAEAAEAERLAREEENDNTGDDDQPDDDGSQETPPPLPQ